MTTQQTTARRALAGAVVGALALAACSPNDGPLAARPQLLTSRLALSSPGVAVGGKVAVDVRIEGASEALGSMEGTIRFDAAKLRFVGQQQQKGTLLVVNSKNATRGELRLAELDVDGLADRKAALVFEVVAPQYISAIRLENALVATRRAQIELKRIEDGGVTVDEALAVASDARLMDMADWKAEAATMYPNNRKGTISLRPGQYRQNLQYGDANLDGAVDAGDAILLLGVASGLNDMITNSDTVLAGPINLNRDYVVAGNVRPANTGSLTLLPGDETDGTRVINSTDALAVLSFAAVLPGTAPVGSIIPGRTPQVDTTIAANVVNVIGTATCGGASGITTNTTWTKDKVYRLTGKVRVCGGATLTIQAGTRIEGAAPTGTGFNAGSGLFIHREGRIDAQGTELEPIVMTCQAAVKTNGCWGGLWIAGNAPINSFGTTSNPNDTTFTGGGTFGTSNPAIAGRTVAGCLQAVGEAAAPLYGGCNPDDSSGVLRYVRVEFGGYVTSIANVELNNLTLGGVGRGTVIDHLQIIGGSDDGIELFGGTVDLKYILSQDNNDDQFDFAEGYSGRVQFLITNHDPQNGDKGLEIDNTPSTPFTLSSPIGTYAQISNVTLIGRLPSDAIGATGNSVNQGIHVRRGFKGRIQNVLMTGFRGFVRIDDPETCQTDVNASGARDSLVIRQGYFWNSTAGQVTSGLASCQGAAGTAFLTASGTNTVLDAALITDTATSPWIVSTNGTRSYRAFERNQPDYRPKPGFTTAGSFAPVTANASYTFTFSTLGVGAPANLAWTRPEFFDNTASYYGAVPVADLARSTIPWYSGWTRTTTSSLP
jgi:hypothetical protein